MKNLHKKIGAMALAGALLMGGVAFSSSSVVHADASFKELMNRIPDAYKDKKDDVGYIISGNGGMFKVLDILGPGNNLSGKASFSNYSEKKIDYEFISSLKDAKKEGGAERLGLKRGGYYGLDLDGLKILIRVW